jgi:NAD(P)-dependent dehydrogenase (short-subunit alcohol dehydrogenase family)
MTERSVAVVTGAGSGIGRGLARIADERGMAVVLADVDEAGLRETASLLTAEPLVVTTDVACEASVEALTEQTYARFGQVDLLFNNAGILRAGASWDIALADWRRVVDVNLMGVVTCVNRFLPRMIAADRPSRIINTASVGGLVSSPYIAPYTATKFAVVALTEALAAELQLTGAKVAVSLLAPGPVRSNIYSDARISGFDAGTQQTVGAMAAYTDSAGDEPETFARWVFEGIDSNRFWLIGQAETFLPLIAARTERILAGINPEPHHYTGAADSQANGRPDGRKSRSATRT